MKVDLSPGEWAGVMTCVKEQARALRRDAETDPSVAAGEGRERADDLDRIASVIREAIADNGRELPELVPGEDGETVTCQHVLTEDDVREQARGRAATYDGWVEQFDTERAQELVRRLRPLQPAGAMCGLPLYVNVLEWDVRNQSSWVEGGAIWVGKSVDTESVETRFGCEAGHDWQLPDTEDWG